MKKKLTLALLSSAILLMGCNVSGETNHVTSDNDLKFHNFIFVSHNGKAFKNDPSNQKVKHFLAFSEAKDKSLHINGKLCNNFNGPAMLKDAVLTATARATMMLCYDDLNKIESAFFVALDKGAKVSFVGEELTIKYNNDEFKLIKKDLVQ